MLLSSPCLSPETLSDLIDGALSRWERQQTKRHLAQCPRCAARLREEMNLRTAAQSVAADVIAPERLRERVFAQREATPQATCEARTTLPVTWTIGGWTMKRRTVLAATAALTFATLTGAVAARHFWNTTPAFAFSDTTGTTWKVQTNLPATIQVLDAKGKLLGQMQSDGGFPGGSDIVLVSLTNTPAHTLHGYGRHLVRGKSGEALGTVVVAPLTPVQKREMHQAGAAAQRGLEALYTDPLVFTATPGESSPSESVMGTIGLAAGYRKKQGLAWKMVGYAAVTADYTADENRESGDKPERQLGKATPIPRTDEVPLPARAQLAQLLTCAPPSGAVPQVYWQRSGENRAIAGGTWKDLAGAGTFTGYGKHEVKDENGTVLLVLTVTPLRAEAR